MVVELFVIVCTQRLSDCNAGLNRISAVQECDATVLNSYSVAGYQKLIIDS